MSKLQSTAGWNIYVGSSGDNSRDDKLQSLEGLRVVCIVNTSGPQQLRTIERLSKRRLFIFHSAD